MNVRFASLALMPALLFLALPVQAEERFAIVIGANAGWSNDRPLRHAEADAEHVRDALVELGGFSPDRVALLRDPNTAEVRAQFRKLSETLRGISEETLVLVYYSGHADERQLHLRGEPLTHADFYDQIRKLPGTVRVGLLDACKSGSILAVKGGRPIAQFEVNLIDELKVSGLALLTSSGADELAQETRALGGSVFTHHLVSGLRGAADTDDNGAVTLAEAYNYAHQRTEADTAGSLAPQRPAFRFELRGQGDVVLTRPAKAACALVLPRTDSERYVVVDEHGWKLVAEGRSSLERSVALALSPGKYQIKRVLPDRLEVAEVSFAPGSQVSAAALTFASQPISSGLVKGRPDERDPAEVLEWNRSEALRLLAAGEPSAALALFDQILADKPDDLPSRRQRGRALVRLAEAYDRVGDHDREASLLRESLLFDPSLVEDPDFEEWYRRIQEHDAKASREKAIEDSVKQELERNPRLTRDWGLSFDLISTRGAIVFVGTYMPTEKIFIDLGFSPIGYSIAAGLKFIPIGRKWSPYVGIGAEASLTRAPTKSEEMTQGTVSANTSSADFFDVFGRNAHLNVGLQYMGGAGFAVELGLGGIVSQSTRTGKFDWFVMPIINFGWYF